MVLRLFNAIDIGTRSPLVELESELEKTDADLKIVHPENIHVTLKFLGNTDEERIPTIEEAMRNAVKDIEPYQATIKGTGVFPNPGYIKVIWVGIDDEGQTKGIATSLEKELVKQGFRKERHDFTPHATIARMRSAQGKDEIKDLVQEYGEKEFGDLRVNSIQLKRSELKPDGPVYTTMSEIEL